MGKKRHLSDSQILARIEQGEFNVEQIDLVRSSENGAIVKHMKRRDTDTVPATYVQVNNNYVVEQDITPFINALIKHRENEIISDLDEIYEVVLGFLAYYMDIEDRLDLLNSEALKATLVFKSRMKVFLVGVDEFVKDGNGDRNVEVIDVYLNIMFIYVISTYKLHGDKLARDSNSKKQLAQLKEKILSIYKELLMSGSGDKCDLLRSGYARIFADKEYDLCLLDSLIRHDDRYSNAVGFLKELRSKSQEIKYEGYYNNYVYSIPDRDKWRVENNIHLATRLSMILDKIDNVEAIIEELCAVCEIDAGDIEFDPAVLNLPFSLFKLEHQKQPDA